MHPSRAVLPLAIAALAAIVAGNLLARRILEQAGRNSSLTETPVTVGLAEGVQLAATVVAPPDPENVPGVLLLAQPSDAGHQVLAKALVRRGFVVGIVEVRGTGGSDRRLVNGSPQALVYDPEAAAEDARALSAWLDGLPGVDPVHLALVGSGNAAPLVLNEMVKDSPFAAAAVIFPTVPPAEHPLGALARRGTPAKVLVLGSAGSKLSKDVADSLRPPTKTATTAARDLPTLAADAGTMDLLARWLTQPDAADI